MDGASCEASSESTVHLTGGLSHHTKCQNLITFTGFSCTDIPKDTFPIYWSHKRRGTITLMPAPSTQRESLPLVVQFIIHLVGAVQRRFVLFGCSLNASQYLLQIYLSLGEFLCFQGACAGVLTCKSVVDEGCKCTRQAGSLLRFNTGCMCVYVWVCASIRVVCSMMYNYTVCKTFSH